MENTLSHIHVACTVIVVGCGAAVVIASTVHIIRDMMRKPAMVELKEDDQAVAQPVRTRRRQRTQATACEHCGVDVSSAQIIRAELNDSLTFHIRVCPGCGKECSNESKG